MALDKLKEAFLINEEASFFRILVYNWNILSLKSTSQKFQGKYCYSLYIIDFLLLSRDFIWWR